MDRIPRIQFQSGRILKIIIVWHTTKRVLAESTVVSGVETNSISRVAETTALAHGVSAIEIAKSG